MKNLQFLWSTVFRDYDYEEYADDIIEHHYELEEIFPHIKINHGEYCEHMDKPALTIARDFISNKKRKAFLKPCIAAKRKESS